MILCFYGVSVLWYYVAFDLICVDIFLSGSLVVMFLIFRFCCLLDFRVLWFNGSSVF